MELESKNQSIIEKLKNCPIYQVPEGWVIDYPQFSKIADEQMHTFWPWDEPEVENDVQDLRVRMTEAEQHAVTENLKLFTLYEMHVGDCYWSGRIMKKFKRPELQRMASFFSAVEFNSHAPFYNKVNELLFLDNEDFYGSWKEDKVMVDRMDFISEHASNPNDLISTAAFSFIEGAILYSSFAFFKHFQSQACGKDLIKNVCRGINLSVGDENTHAVGGALIFKQLMDEVAESLTEEEKIYIDESIDAISQAVKEHEFPIIDKLFEKGDLGGITKENMQNFVMHRVDLCRAQLGKEPMYEGEITEDFIESWFYKDINSVAFHDFFSGNGKEYNIDWTESKFGKVWENK